MLNDIFVFDLQNSSSKNISSDYINNLHRVHSLKKIKMTGFFLISSELSIFFFFFFK